MERMMPSGTVVEVVLLSLPLLLALGAVWLGGWRVQDIAPLRNPWLLPGFALAAGAGLGLALLAAAPQVAEFAPEGIFAADAIWGASLAELMVREGLPSRYALGQLAAALLGSTGGVLATLGGLAALILLLDILRQERGLSLGRAAWVFTLLALAGALATYQLAHVGAWGLRRLSFWAFLVLLVAFQQWRQYRRCAFLRAALLRGARRRLAPG